ncbi:MAG: aminotransferase class III-fold pyridoxal phosphate-dependent enzyme [bacterium]
MFEDKFDDKILEHLEEKEKFPSFPLPLTVKKAENSYLFDINEKKYLDLTSNRENNPFGYSNIIIESENRFLDSELFDSYDSLKLKEILKSATGLEKVYFSSSLGEIYNLSGNLINIHLNNTGKDKILLSCASANKDLYEIKGIKEELVPVNKDSLLKTLFSRSVGAVIIQIIQKTDEFIIAEEEYLKEVRKLCDKNNALLVFDCANTAPLRLNNGLFNYNPEIKPDILIISKGLSQGFPFSTLIASEKTPQIELFESKAGLYSPAYSAACELIQDFQTNKTDEIISSNIEYITQKLGELSETHISLVDYYSSGMFFTLVVDISAYEFAREAFNKGVIVDTLNDSKIILAPPYNIKKDETDYLILIFDEVFDLLAKFDRMK